MVQMVQMVPDDSRSQEDATNLDWGQCDPDTDRSGGP